MLTADIYIHSPVHGSLTADYDDCRHGDRVEEEPESRVHSAGQLAAVFQRVQQPSARQEVGVVGNSLSHHGSSWGGTTQQLQRPQSVMHMHTCGLKVEYDLFPLYWSWDHFSVEKA